MVDSAVVTSSQRGEREVVQTQLPHGNICTDRRDLRTEFVTRNLNPAKKTITSGTKPLFLATVTCVHTDIQRTFL
jgi:hypothetical protein